MTDFEWSALPSALLVALARSLRVRVADAPEALLSSYGRVPSSDFVFERWVLLRDAWLSHDADAAMRIAVGLQRLGVGRADSDLSDHAAALDYLHSCRASRAVREVVLPALLEAGGGQGDAAPDSSGSSLRPAEDEDPVLVALARLGAERVPDLVAALDRGLELFGEDAALGEQAAPSLVIAAMFALTSIGKEAGASVRDEVLALMPHEVSDVAMAVASGARAWADSGDSDGLFGSLLFSAMIVAADGDPAVDDAFVTGVLDVLSGGPGREPPVFDARPLVTWSRSHSGSGPPSDGPVMGGATDWPAAASAGAAQWGSAATSWPASGQDGGSGTPAFAGASESGFSEVASADGDSEIWTDATDPIAEEVGRWIDDPGYVHRYLNGVQWLASDVGATAVFADEPVQIGDRPVTALRVLTMGRLARPLTDRQLAAALSDANVHDGINAISGGDGLVAVRSSLAVHRDNAGWMTGPMCIATVASALAALHLPPELRLESAGTSRDDPSFMVANLGGWEVDADDEADHVLPLLDQMQATIDWLGPFPHKVRRTENEIAVTLPGPNGRLDGRRAHRRGLSDDQVLVMSKVTRPPWGAGVKFVLRLPTGYDEAASQDLAVEANLTEWDMAPNVIVWGGWSGEAGALRLTSFLPQVLMSSSAEASQRLVGSFLQYTIRRGEATAVQLGLA